MAAGYREPRTLPGEVRPRRLGCRSASAAAGSGTGESTVARSYAVPGLHPLHLRFERTEVDRGLPAAPPPELARAAAGIAGSAVLTALAVMGARADRPGERGPGRRRRLRGYRKGGPSPA